MIPSPAIAGRRCTCVLFSALMLWLASSWTEAAAPAIEWSASAYAVTENAGTLEVRVLRSGDLAGTSVVAFASTNGTAASGVDYTGSAGTLTFLPNESNQVVNISLLDNASGQPSRFFNLRLSGLSNAVPGLQTNATVTVLDDETAAALDPWFDAGAGAGADIFALGLMADSRIVVGGQFTGFNGVPGLDYLAVLQPDGAVDAGFNSSDTALNGPVYAASSAADGSLFIGGEFTSVGGLPRSSFAKLKPGGGLDTNFMVAAVNNSLRAILVQPDGKILIAGRFTQVGGQPRNRIARLNSDGSLDTGFNPGGGANNAIRGMALQSDGRILIGGQFTTFDIYTRNRIARLQTNGTLDTTFNPGTGADAQVRSVAVQADGKILVGGDFEQFDGSDNSCVARLQSNGQTDTDFYAGLSLGDQIRAVAPAPGGKVWIGGSFISAGGAERYYLALLGPDGTADPFRADAGFEVNAILTQPDGQTLVAGDFGSIVGLPAGRLARLNTVGPLLPAPQIQLAANTLSINESAGQAIVTVTRRGDFTGPAAVPFSTRASTALAGADYLSTAGTISFAPQETAKILSLSIVNDSLPEPDETFIVALTNPVPPAVLGRITNASITIQSDDMGFEFSTNTFATSEPEGSAMITVRRGGTGSDTVSVGCFVNSGTALAGADFIATNGALIFQPGETQKVFTVTLVADGLTEGTETAVLRLTNASAGAALGTRTSATLTMEDVDSTFNWYYATVSPEADPSVWGRIIRTGNLHLPATVDWSVVNGTATGGLDFITDAGTATFAPGEGYLFVGVSLINDGLVEGDENLYFRLSSPTGGAKLGPATNALATIVDNDAGFGFVATNLAVSELSPSVTLTIRRYDDGSGPLNVEFFTSDGTAHAGVNFVASSGLLNFLTNTATRDVSISLRDECGLTSNRTFTVSLRNPSLGGALGTNAVAVVTVQGNDGPGQRDLTFSLSPLIIFNTPIEGLAALPDGRSVAGIYGAIVSNGWYVSDLPVVVRLDEQGRFDPTFPDAFFESASSPRVIKLQRDGKMLMSLNTGSTEGHDLSAVFRLLPSGYRDGGFSPPAFGPVRYGGRDAMAFVEQPDGRILVARNAYTRDGPNPFIPHPGVARLLANGSVDPSFDPGTGAETDEEQSGVVCLDLQADGRILLGGLFTSFNGVLRPGLARLEPNGSLDLSFNPGGGSNPLHLGQVMIQPDQRILIGGGFTSVAGVAGSGLARLLADGTLDSTFDPGVISGGGIYRLLMQPNGRLVIGGSFTTVQGHARFGLARLNSDGSLDLSFDPAPHHYSVLALALQPDGRILVSDASTGLWRVEGDPTPRVREVARANGVAHLRLASRPGKTYALEASTNLVHWLPLQTNTATDCALEFLDAASPASRRFYRAVQLTP